MLASLAIAYGYAISAAAGWTLLVVGLAGLVAVGWAMAGRIRVDQRGVAARRALLPWWAVGQVRALTPGQLDVARGPRGDRSAWEIAPPATGGSGAVLLTLVDPDDPHRTWLLVSRLASTTSSTWRP